MKNKVTKFVKEHKVIFASSATAVVAGMVGLVIGINKMKLYRMDELARERNMSDDLYDSLTDLQYEFDEYVLNNN